MEKYSLLREQLLYEGTVEEGCFFEPSAVSETDILRAHDSDYWKRLSSLKLTPAEQRRSGFPHSEALIQREVCIMQGTLAASLYALEFGAAANIAGGTHHAFAHRAEGFCLLNDIAISALYLLHHELVQKILVVDLDVHQGNGTAAIFKNHPSVFTFSMHGRDNYPLHKEQSDLDIALPKGTGDKEYLEQLQHHLPQIFESAAPDFVFFQSGVDVLATDKLGHLGMSIQGCRRRDEVVLQLCRQHNVPVCMSMGGGYSHRIADIVEAHANTFRLTRELFF